MSLSAPPRCSLFVPVPGSKQLALVKKELHLWNAILVEKVNLPPLSASIHLTPLSLSLPPPSPFSLFFPLSVFPFYFRGIFLYLQLNMFGRAEGEAWHSLWIVQSISEGALSGLLFTVVLYMPTNNNNTSLCRQRKGVESTHGTNKGPLTVEQGLKFIIRWVINSILWIASQCSHPGTIDDIQPTWLNPVSKGDGWCWAHLPRNHVIAVRVNQTWIKRFLCCSWQTVNWKAETKPHAESACHQLEMTAGMFFWYMEMVVYVKYSSLRGIILCSVCLFCFHASCLTVNYSGRFFNTIYLMRL